MSYEYDLYRTDKKMIEQIKAIEKYTKGVVDNARK